VSASPSCHGVHRGDRPALADPTGRPEARLVAAERGQENPGTRVPRERKRWAMEQTKRKVCFGQRWRDSRPTKTAKVANECVKLLISMSESTHLRGR
jgi:hypothetical protein